MVSRLSTGASALTCLLISMLALVGCIPGHTVEVTTPEQVDVTVTGTLAGERTQERECVWLIDRVGTKFVLMLPTGWSITYEPVRLIDPAGGIFAEEGDALSANGPAVFGESICSSGSPFVVDHIEKL